MNNQNVIREAGGISLLVKVLVEKTWYYDELKIVEALWHLTNRNETNKTVLINSGALQHFKKTVQKLTNDVRKITPGSYEDNMLDNCKKMLAYQALAIEDTPLEQQSTQKDLSNNSAISNEPPLIVEASSTIL